MSIRRVFIESLAALTLLGCAEPAAKSEPAFVTGIGGADSGSCSESSSPNAWASWPLPDPTIQSGATAQHYTEGSPDVAIDDVTGLSWQRRANENTSTWEEARQYCGCLTLGGHDDWQLPSRMELVSIVDFTRQDPALDSLAFPDTPFEWFWSSSPVASDGELVWYVAFFDGNTHTSNKDSSYRVRCVRHAEAKPKRYLSAADGTVSDALTGLTWQRATSPTQLNWAEARAYCAGLALAGGGFRLPNMKELQSLIDESASDPAIDGSQFPETPSEGYWAATPLAGSESAAWFVNFTSGVAYNSLVERSERVRCVR